MFLEPPPPPPAPLGVANGTGTLPAVPEPVLEPKAPEQPKEAPRPEVKEPERLQRVDVAAKPKPKPKPKPQAKAVAEPRPEPAPADAAPGVAAGTVGGEAGGVVGGVKGGFAGGVLGGVGTAPVPAGQVAHPPTLVHRVAPVYPEDARRREIEGLVVLEAILDREGRIEPGVKVVRSIPALDGEALRAVEKWRFRPARDEHGRNLRVVLEVPIRFVLR